MPLIETVGTPALWAAFTGAVLFLLALDLGVFHRKSHAVSMREAAAWSVVWVALSLAFNGWVAHRFGRGAGMDFLTGYLLEKSLSVDNLFVFLVLFTYFAVPSEHQHRVLFWGILGALVMRAAFIAIGAALLQRFEWIMYVFGAFLVYTGYKLLAGKGEKVEPEHNPIVRFFRRFVPITDGYRGGRFAVREGGRWMATPLLLVLAVVEGTDVVFAVDSIPAVFGVTRDPFLVYTSNVCAILGLRALYFLLAGMMGRFGYLAYGLGLILIFVGAKMLVEHWVKVPSAVSLGAVGTLLAASVGASLLWPPSAAQPSDQDASRGAPGRP